MCSRNAVYIYIIYPVYIYYLNKAMIPISADNIGAQLLSVVTIALIFHFVLFLHKLRLY